MNLTREQRRTFIAGHCPQITGTGECPWPVGHQQQIAKDLTFTVERVVRKGEKWHLGYVVRDRRHAVRNLRRTPPVRPGEFGDDLDELRYPRPPTPDLIDAAGEQSAYTTGPSSVDECGEAVDPKTQAHYAAQAAATNLQRRVSAAGTGSNLPIDGQLAEIIAEAKRRGVDVSGEVRVIRKRIESIQRKIVHGRAA